MDDCLAKPINHNSVTQQTLLTSISLLLGSSDIRQIGSSIVASILRLVFKIIEFNFQNPLKNSLAVKKGTALLKNIATQYYNHCNPPVSATAYIPLSRDLFCC